MPRKSNAYIPSPKTIEDVAALDEYQVLGLTPGASSEGIGRAMRVERWPWHLLEEDARALATKRRIEAYGLLSNPRRRAEYDRSHYRREDIVALVGEDNSVFGTAWVAGWSVLALLLFMIGPDQAARLMGLAAPGYEEIAVYHAAACEGCAPYYTREFLSDVGFFHWIMNSPLLWILPAAVGVLIGATLRTAAARTGGQVIVTARMLGWKDTGIRLVLLVIMIAVPIVLLVLYFVLPPKGIEIPGQ